MGKADKGQKDFDLVEEDSRFRDECGFELTAQELHWRGSLQSRN